MKTKKPKSEGINRDCPPELFLKAKIANQAVEIEFLGKELALYHKAYETALGLLKEKDDLITALAERVNNFEN